MIRRARSDDLAALLDLVAEYCAADGHEFERATAEAGLAPLLADESRGVIWVTDDLTAYAVVTWGWSVEAGGAEAVLDEIYARHQGRGTGTQLIEQLVADCTERGIKRIFLETEQPNADARRLYARHGFTAEASIWMARWL